MNKMVNFMKYRSVYFLVSSIIIIAGLVNIATGGFTYSIDFVGGTNIKYQVNKPITVEQAQAVIEKNGADVEKIEVANNVLSARLKAIDEKKEAAIRKALETDLKTKLTVLSSETVGPTLGKETIEKTIIASIIAMIGILFYITYAFKGLNFAIAAIVAMLHDLLITIGTYSFLSRFLGAEVDTLFVTAILTSMSFSVHDTIIIFDKIREYRKTSTITDIEYNVNKALVQTLVRSVNNSMTIIFMLLALTLLGGSTIRFFVAALLIGTVTGTYSSPFIATPVLVWLEKRKK